MAYIGQSISFMLVSLTQIQQKPPPKKKKTAYGPPECMHRKIENALFDFSLLK